MFFWIEMRETIWRYKLVADTFLAAPCLGPSSRDLDIRHPDPKDVWKQCIFNNSNLDYSFGQGFSTLLMLWLLNTVPHIVWRPTIKLFSLICITVILLLLWIVMQISNMQIVLKGLFNPQRELNTQVNNSCFRTSTFSVGLSGTLCSPSHSPYPAWHDWKSCGLALAYGLSFSKGQLPLGKRAGMVRSEFRDLSLSPLLHLLNVLACADITWSNLYISCWAMQIGSGNRWQSPGRFLLLMQFWARPLLVRNIGRALHSCNRAKATVWAWTQQKVVQGSSIGQYSTGPTDRTVG